MIERLSTETAVLMDRIGGKACGLVRLMNAGLPVPDAWCLPADVEFDDVGLAGALTSLLAPYPDTRFAVRSSASAEDLEGASFAGIYDTFLGVRGVSEIAESIHACRASLRSDAAVAYRAQRGISEDVGMAVLIQRLVEPEVAGVLLTANPQRGFANEIVIDACYGLGEALVSGRTDPDHFVLDRASGEVREQRIGEKAIALRCAEIGAPKEEVVPEADRSRACLSEAQRMELHRLAQTVGERIGPGMDVEWALADDGLHVLQVRPIVGLPPLNPKDIWSRKFGDEYMADYTTPSGYTFLVDWIREHSFTNSAKQIGNHAQLAMEPLCRHNGYVYFSARYAAVGARAMPKDSREEAMRGWFPPSVLAWLAAEPFEPMLLVRTLLGPLRVPGASMARNVVALDVHARRIMTEFAPKRPDDYAARSDAELATDLAAMVALGDDHFRIIRWGMGQYAPVFHGMLERSLKSWIGDGADVLYQEMVSGLPGTHTAEINRDVYALGALARTSTSLRAALLSETDPDRLRARAPDTAFWSAFDGFLDLHGHRGATRDIAQPRWRESPGLILALVRAQVAGDEPPPDPQTLAEASAERRRTAESTAFASLGGGLTGWLRRRLLRWMYGHCCTFTVYRENQRYYLDVILAQLRGVVLEHGRRLQARGLLEDPWSAFLLEKSELVAYFAGASPIPDLSSVIEERHAHYDTWRGRLPATFLYDDVETEGEVVEGDPLPGAEAGASDGLGASRGVATGRLRVLHDVIELDRVERGDILVAENIDPGWTSVFPLLAGLITETGGLLSHGALLAREYGIPAVMGVRGATRRFRTGEQAEIDGATGRVTELDSPAE
jgi:phosphohistidine swiveling domain-containing protein